MKPKKPARGRPRLPKDQKAVSGSITMTRAQWAYLDAIRGGMAKGKYIASLLPM
jgi:hypothetical protein